jgi:2'-5' RNA ligase
MPSALIVPIPGTASIVDEYRATMDPSHALGVPPHVTVLFPFASPDDIGDAGVARLRDEIRSLPRFAATFAGVDWFGEDVVWLRPVDDTGFRRLTETAHRLFPSFAPYGGAYEDAVPHLTIGMAPTATPEILRDAAAAITPSLPISAVVNEVHYGVFTGASGSWHVQHRLPLGRDEVCEGTSGGSSNDSTPAQAS